MLNKSDQHVTEMDLFSIPYQQLWFSGCGKKEQLLKNFLVIRCEKYVKK